MPPDLTAENAFDKVLDALAKSVRRGAEDRCMHDIKDHQFREASGAASDALGKVRQLEKEIADLRSEHGAFSALYKAVEKAIAGFIVGDDERELLREIKIAFDAAKNIVD